MSILQQILDQMFVDPQILEELDEEQKQILFIKMREEQVKRWKQQEEQWEKGDFSVKRNSNGRRIQWLKGIDGEVWVWVMGEHRDDLTIDEITENRALEEARLLAERELSTASLAEDYGSTSGCVSVEDEDTLKHLLSKMEVHGRKNRTLESAPDDNSRADLTEVCRASWKNNWDGQPALPLKANLQSGLKYNSTFAVNDAKFATSSVESSSADKLEDHGIPTTYERGSTHIIPVQIERVKSSVVSHCKKIPIMKYHDLSNEMSDGKISGRAHKPSLLTAFGQNTEYDSKTLNYNSSGNVFHHYFTTENGSNSLLFDIADNKVLDVPLPYSDRIAYTLPTRLQHSSFRGEPSKIQNFTLSSSSAAELVKMRSSQEDRSTHEDKELSKRQSEIFELIKEKHQKIDEEAEVESERANKAWEEQERKARDAEAQIRRIARKAREQHRQHSLRTSISVLPILKETSSLSLRDAIKHLPRPPKPKSRQAVIDWFRMEELKMGAGLDPKTNKPAPWFHGIISRSQADNLLRGHSSGSFLVRVSDRIWGYTVSCIIDNGINKHFLVERIPQGYQFLGTNQVVHKNLYDLITYHESAPITAEGNGILKWAVGQAHSPADYWDIFGASPPE